MAQYLPLLAMLILGGLFAGLSFVASKLFAPQRPTPAKLEPYESGIVPDTKPGRFPVQFYLVAMIFIIFDIEIIFIYPWAVIYRQLGAFGLWEMMIFSAMVFAAFVYLIGNGALDWGPIRHLRQSAPREATMSERTTGSTIRRTSSRAPSKAPAA